LGEGGKASRELRPEKGEDHFTDQDSTPLPIWWKHHIYEFSRQIADGVPRDRS
jgi:hypothetical protein